MTLAQSIQQRSAYLMRTRPEDGTFKRFSPDDSAKKGKEKLDERPQKLKVRRRRLVDDYDDEEPKPHKTMPRRGRATRSRGTRGRK